MNLIISVKLNVFNFNRLLPALKLSRLNHERNMRTKHYLQAETVLNPCVCGVGCERTTGDGLFHWRVLDYGHEVMV